MKRFATGLIRLLLFTVFVVGLPMLLVRYGSPLPDHFPQGEEWRVLVTFPPDDATLSDIIVIAAWLAWAAVITAVVVRIVHLVREEPVVVPPTERWRVPGPVRALSAVLLGTTATTAVATIATGGATPAVAADLTPGDASTHHDTTEPVRQPAETDDGVTSASASPYLVRSGDTLWDIADHQLDDPMQWQDIYALNEHRPQPDGAMLTNPDLIRPGWKLLLPTTTTPPPSTRPGTNPPSVPDPSTTGSSTPPGPSTPPPSDTAAPSTSTPSSTPPTNTTPPTAPPSSVTAAPVHDPDDDSDSPYPQQVNGGFHLPTGAWIAASLATAVTASIALARARRRRRAASGAPTQTTPIPAKIHAILDAAAEAPTEPAPDAAGIDTAGNPVTITTLTRDGLGLTGPGALNVTRSILATHLAERDGGTILITETNLTALLPEDAPTPLIPGRLSITDDTNDAIQTLHTEILARTRADDTGTPTGPPLLVITSDTHLAELAAAHADLNLSAILTGTFPNATLEVDADGTITASTGTGPVPDVVRLHTLTAPDLAGILATLTDTASTKAPEPKPEPPHAEPLQPPTVKKPALAPPKAHDADSSLVHLNLFGPTTVTIDETPLATGFRNKSRELLAYLAWAHPHGANRTTVIEDLLPEITMSKAANHLRTLTANTRRTLRAATGQPDEMYIHTDNERYRLDADTIDCDLWRFNQHLTDAATPRDTTDEITHLSAAAALYTGDFLDDAEEAEWAEPVREQLRQRITDALTHLADLHLNAGNTSDNLAALEKACQHAPVNEPLHQRAITANLAAGRSDAALQLFRRLKQALRDIDEQPEQGTYGLFNEPPT